MSTAAACTHSFPDPFPQPIEQIGNCRGCGISYQEARQATVCGLPHHDHPESRCTEPAGHYRRDRDSHAAPLVIDGRRGGAVAWDEPARPTDGDQP